MNETAVLKQTVITLKQEKQELESTLTDLLPLLLELYKEKYGKVPGDEFMTIPKAQQKDSLSSIILASEHKIHPIMAEALRPHTPFIGKEVEG